MEVASRTYNDTVKRPRLASFYKGKNIFITGTTGFIGKVTLLKLLTSFPDSGNVYVMLRSKKGMTPQQRLNKMIQAAPFNPKEMRFDQNPYLADKREEMCREFEALVNKIDWSKVIAVDGDMSREGLGLDDETSAMLRRNINIIFSIAASVSFDAPLKQNLRDNYLGARNILQLAKSCEKIDSFVHVSTFYVNHHLKHVEEKVLPMNRDHEKMAELISWAPDSWLESMGPEILENRANSYVFTKAMGENLVQKHEGQLPICIVRPSIVTHATNFPEPGWVDSINGPMGLGMLGSLGILRNIDWNYWGVSDMVPVDYVANFLLVAAERTARLYPKEIKVYNCSTSSANPITWGACFEGFRKEGMKVPSIKALRVPIELPKHRRANKIGFALSKLNELLFAYFIDLLLVICRHKPLLVRMTKKLHRGYKILLPFSTTEHTCSNDDLIEAFEELDDNDKNEFEFDVRAINWDSEIRNAVYGSRFRLFKEDLSNVPAARFKMRALQIVELMFEVLFYCLVAWACYKIFTEYWTPPSPWPKPASQSSIDSVRNDSEELAWQEFHTSRLAEIS